MKPLPGVFKRGRIWWYRDRRNGGDKWRSLKTTKLTEANAKVRAMLGGPALGDRVRVSDFYDEWLENYVHRNEGAQQTNARRSGGRSEKGYKDAKRRKEMYLDNSDLARLWANHVTEQHCWDYRRFVETHDLKPTSVAGICGDLRSAFKWAVGKYVDRSPIPPRFLPKLEVTPPDPLSADELEAVCSLPGKHGFICRFLAGTGLRWGAAKLAQASDVRQVQVDGQRMSELFVPHGKGGRPQLIPLPPALAGELRDRIGRLVDYSSGSSFRKQIIKLTGIEDFHVHRLRDTYACALVDAGVPLEEIRILLGHRHISTTQRYASASQNTVRRSVLQAATVANTVAEKAQVQ